MKKLLLAGLVAGGLSSAAYAGYGDLSVKSQLTDHNLNVYCYRNLNNDSSSKPDNKTFSLGVIPAKGSSSFSLTEKFGKGSVYIGCNLYVDDKTKAGSFLFHLKSDTQKIAVISAGYFSDDYPTLSVPQVNGAEYEQIALITSQSKS